MTVLGGNASVVRTQRAIASERSNWCDRVSNVNSWQIELGTVWPNGVLHDDDGAALAVPVTPASVTPVATATTAAFPVIFMMDLSTWFACCFPGNRQHEVEG